MPSADGSPMARSLPPNIVSLFTQALKSYQLSNATFRVLCSLTPSSLSSTPAESLVIHPPQVPPKELLILDSSFNPPTLAHQRMALSAIADHARPGTENSHKSRVLLLLAINNADKAPKPASFPQRLAMMYIFAQDLLHHSSLPFPSPPSPSGPSTGSQPTNPVVDIAVTTEPYFHAKSRAIADASFYHGANSSPSTPQPIEQIFLTGFDTLIRIFNPKYYSPDPSSASSSVAACLDPFFARARLRVTTRADGDWGSAADQAAYLEGLRRGGLESVGGREEWADRIEMVEGKREGGGDVAVSSTKVREAVKGGDWKALERLVSRGVAEWIRREGLYMEESGV